MKLMVEKNFALGLTNSGLLTDVLRVQQTHLQTSSERIQDLESRLLMAENRATVAEEQLRRVHKAVRAFKKRQLAARAAQMRASSQAARQQEPARNPNAYSSWAAPDPSLDERLDEYMANEFEPDSSRDWMLGT